MPPQPLTRERRCEVALADARAWGELAATEVHFEEMDL